MHRTHEQVDAAHASATTTNLVYHGGATERATSKSYAIFWKPSGSVMSSTYQNLIVRYFNDVGGSSLYGIMTQYSDTGGPIVNSSTLGGSFLDTTPYPTGNLSDQDIQAAVSRAISANGWTANGTSEFFVFTAFGKKSCFDSSTCAFTDFCAYHSGFSANGAPVLYANMPYAGTSASCQVTVSPNNDLDADSTISVLSHEHFETVTDPNFDGWFDDTTGSEIGDKCAWTFGTIDATSHANVTLNGHPYIVQQEWSNANTGCVLATGQGPSNNNFASAVSISIPSSTEGSNGLATVESGEPTSCGIGATVWYRLVPQSSGMVSLDTTGSDYDTVVALYTGSTLTSLQSLGCNDSDPRFSNRQTSFMTAALTAGQTYYVQLGGLQGAQGSFSLTLVAAGNPPSNDGFGSAQQVTISSSTDGTSLGASLQASEPTPCGNIGSTIWFRLTPQSSGVVAADTIGSGYDTVLALYSGSALANLTNIACNDDDPRSTGGRTSYLTASVTSGQTYFFQVGGFDAEQGNVRLTLTSQTDVTLGRVFTNDGGSDVTTEKTTFARSDPVRLVALISNNTGSTATVSGDWEVTGPAGPALSLTSPLQTDPGSTLWYLSATIAPTAALGSYTYTFSMNNGGVVSSKSSVFTVVGSGPTATVSPTTGPASTGTPTSPAASTTPTRTPTPIQTSTPTPTATSVTPGKGFGISSDAGGVHVSWSPATGQTGWIVGRLVDGAVTFLPPVGMLDPSTTSLDDPTAPPGLDCYAALPQGGPFILSDKACAIVGFGSSAAGPAPQHFTMRLNQSHTATLTWDPPQGGQEDSYIIATFGSPDFLPVDGTATSKQMPAPNPTCFAIGAMRNGNLMGYTDWQCGDPTFTNITS